MGSRIRWIDVAKGIAVLSVVIVHSISNFIIRGGCLSFDMPLFFICSGMTYRCSKNWSEWGKHLKRNFTKLLLTGAVLYLIQNVLFCLQHKITAGEILNWKALLMFNGMPTKKYPSVGMVWFFCVLFFSIAIYDTIMMKIPNKFAWIPFTVLAFLGYFISQYGLTGSGGKFLPLSFDVSLVTSVYLYLGKNINKEKLYEYSQKNLVLIGSFFAWALGFVLTWLLGGTHLQLSSRTYPAFPLCVITGAIGTLAILVLSIRLEKLTHIYNFFEIMGKNSLVFFEVHYLDFIIKPIWETPFNGYIDLVVRMTVDTLITLSIVYLKNKKKKLKEAKMK